MILQVPSWVQHGSTWVGVPNLVMTNRASHGIDGP